MRNSRISVFLSIVLSLIILVGCASTPTESKTPSGTSSNNLTNPEKAGSNTLSVKLKLTNPQAKKDSYLVHFVVPGQKQTKPGEATQSGKSIPFETGQDGTVVIDFEENSSYLSGLVQSEESTKPNSLELYVTTKEDIYIRNPLNAPTVIDFEIKKPGEGEIFDKIFFKQSEIELNITDKYPDGVLSLTFPDAVFVVKLKFEQAPANGYEVSLFLPDKQGDGIGTERIGRVSRDFQYWDTPFFKGEIKSGKRAVVIRHFETNDLINYAGYPLWLEFREDGTCVQGDIIEIEMP